MIWRIVTLFLAYWLLAAHFLRGDYLLICVAIALFPLLALTQHKMALRALQFGLILAVLIVWLPSTFSIAEYRIVTERPWLRMVSIMAGVMIFNFFVAWQVSALINPKQKD